MKANDDATCATHFHHQIAVDGKTNPDAAWFYTDPKPEAAEIKDYVAFWHGVKVEG